MIETPQLVETPAQLVATIHIETSRSKIQQAMGPGIGETMAAVKAQGIGPGGWKLTDTRRGAICTSVMSSVRNRPPTRPIGAPNSAGR